MNLPSDLSAQQEVKLAGPLSRRTAGQRARGPVAEAHVPRRRLLAPSTWRESRAPRGAALALGALSRTLPLTTLGAPRHTQPGPWPPAPRPSGTQEGPDPGFSLPFLWVSAPPCPGLPHSGAGAAGGGREAFLVLTPRGPGSDFSGPHVSTPGPSPPPRRA